MSIYNHFPSKKEIEFALVSDFVRRAHRQSHPKQDWRQWLQLTFSDIFNATSREPQYLALMIRSDNIGMASMSVFEGALSCLGESGFSENEAVLIFHRILSFTLGAALLQVNLNQAGSAHPAPKEKRLVHHIMSGGEFDMELASMIESLPDPQLNG